MTETSSHGLPAKLVVATDLSPRCDRALDRGIELATQWGASLTALYVFDAPREPDQILAWAAGEPTFDIQREAAKQLRLDLLPLGERADFKLVRSNSPSDVICRVAAEVGAGLVVTGLARDEPFGRFALGSTVEDLARTLQEPLLIVRNRVRAPYGRIAVATDLSERAQAALHTAVRWFSDSDVHLVHAAERPSTLAGRGGDGGSEPTTALQARCEQFAVDSGIRPEALHRVAVVDGDLAASLTRYVRHQQIDLVAVGAHEGRGILDVILGSALEKLLQWLPCDVMVAPIGK
jgi:nucleotide-binding universal stress UspA family protein